MAGAARKKNVVTPQPSADMDELTTARAVQVESVESQPPLPQTPRQRNSRGRKRLQQQSTTEPWHSSSSDRNCGPDDKSTAGSIAAVDHQAPNPSHGRRDRDSSGCLPESPSSTLSGGDGSVPAVKQEAEAKAALGRLRHSRQVVAGNAEIDATQTSMPPEGTNGAPVTPQPAVRRRNKRAH